MNRSLIVSAAVVAALSAAACSKPADKAATDTAGQAIDKAQDVTAAGVGMASAALPRDAQGFVTAMGMSDMYEIQAATIAQARGSAAGVKDFAKIMATDHTATTNAVKAILAKGAVLATPPAALDQRRQGMIDNLNSAPAAGFDKTYLDQQVAAHNEALNLLKNYADNGDNAELQTFARETAPKVQTHLEHAQSLDAAAKPAA